MSGGSQPIPRPALSEIQAWASVSLQPPCAASSVCTRVPHSVSPGAPPVLQFKSTAAEPGGPWDSQSPRQGCGLTHSKHTPDRYPHTHISPVFWISFPFRSPESIEWSSLGYTTGPHLVICFICSSVYESESAGRSVLSDSLWPRGLQPARLLCPQDSPGKNTGVGCHSLL